MQDKHKKVTASTSNDIKMERRSCPSTPKHYQVRAICSLRVALILNKRSSNPLQGVKVKSPKLRAEDESGEEESELNLKKPTPGAGQHKEIELLVILVILS